jgi:hypothetical protein
VHAHKRGPKQIFKTPASWVYKKTQNFMLISKMQTYISDKMHPKRVMSQKRSPKNLFSACFGQKKWILVSKIGQVVPEKNAYEN